MMGIIWGNAILNLTKNKRKMSFRAEHIESVINL